MQLIALSILKFATILGTRESIVNEPHYSNMTTTPTPRGIVVFSGGSAANSLVDVFNKVVESRKCSLSYIIPISDNGGSSSELIRVFGGPGIGDVRSK